MEKSLNKLFENCFKEHWNYSALSNYKGECLQYKDVARRIEKLHILFEECGLQKGDKVALCDRNQSNWAVVYLATHKKNPRFGMCNNVMYTAFLKFVQDRDKNSPIS